MTPLVPRTADICRLLHSTSSWVSLVIPNAQQL